MVGSTIGRFLLVEVMPFVLGEDLFLELIVLGCPRNFHHLNLFFFFESMSKLKINLGRLN